MRGNCEIQVFVYNVISFELSRQETPNSVGGVKRSGIIMLMMILMLMKVLMLMMMMRW